MPGPAPKSLGLRQRRNKSATQSLLPAEIEPRGKKPRLPTCPNEGGWHNMARRWWNDVWSSPMRYEFLRGDEPALFRLVALVDRFWKFGGLDVAREIRLLEREFGLTPLSRRRLEWNVAHAEDAKDKYELRRSRRAKIIDGSADPRQVLGSSE